MPFVNSGAAAAGAITPNLLPAGLIGGRVRVAQADFTLASDAAGTYTAPIRLPIGARVLALFLHSTVSLGSTTVAVGIAGAVGRYRAAAVFTAVDTPTLFGVLANMVNPLAAEEQIILTTAAASLPAGGTLRVGFLYVVD